MTHVAGCTTSRSRIAPGISAFGVLLAGLLVGWIAGCSQTGPSMIRPTGSPDTIEVIAFRTPEVDETDRAVDDEASPLATEAPRLGAGDERALRDPTPVPMGGEAESSSAISTPDVGKVFIVDRIVGQVNGRPISAHDFLEPLAAELRADGQRLPLNQFIAKAQADIVRRLNEVILNELLLAEAEADLKPEQRQGLFGFLRDLEDDLRIREGGTRSELEQALQEERGVSINEALALERERILIQSVYLDRVRRRVIVAWRDIQNEYRRRYDEFNPPARVVVSRIRLIAELEDDDVVAVTQRLEDGEPFNQVARDLGVGNDGRWQTFEVDVDGIQQLEEGPIRTAIEELGAEEWAGPFDRGSTVWWVHIDARDTPEPRSLYEVSVQRELRDRLQSQRELEAQNNYFRKLFEQGIIDDIEVMSDRLTDVAIMRYARRP